MRPCSRGSPPSSALRPRRLRPPRPRAPHRKFDPAPSARTTLLGWDPNIKTGRLPNGLTYYVLPNHKPAKRARSSARAERGSTQEDEDQHGLAHFTEHMAFNGTRRFPKHDLTEFVERSGARIGPDVNATTSFDETVSQAAAPHGPARARREGHPGAARLRRWRHLRPGRGGERARRDPRGMAAEARGQLAPRGSAKRSSRTPPSTSRTSPSEMRRRSRVPPPRRSSALSRLVSARSDGRHRGQRFRRRRYRIEAQERVATLENPERGASGFHTRSATASGPRSRSTPTPSSPR